MRHRHPSAGAPSSDGGFTLVELVVTIVIMGAITVPLADFVVSYFVHTTKTSSRLNESHDEQLAAAYFAGDVANVGVRDSSDTLTQSVWTGSFPAGSCGSSAAAADQVLLLRWDDATWSGSAETKVVDSVAYVRATAPGETQLQRVDCSGSTVQTQVVVHNLDPSVTPAVTCAGPTQCTSASVPKTIRLQVGISDPAGDGQPFTLTLSGQRRQS